MNQTLTAALPRWQLDSIYPGLDAPELAADVAALHGVLDETEAFWDARGVRGGRRASDPAADLATLERALALLERAAGLLVTVRTYLNLRVSTDAFDAEAQARASAMRAPAARYQALTARFKSWLRGVDVAAAAADSPRVAALAYVLERYRQEAEHLLSDEAEALAAELDASGGAAWAKLYQDLISRERVTADPEGSGAPRELGVAELRTLQAHVDPAVRRRAYEAELELLGRNRLSFAAAMNGVKGQVATLTRRRGWDRPLDYALFQHGVSAAALAAMHAACEERFPRLRDYLRAKARLLGKERLAWYDLSAPLPQAAHPGFTWEEAQDVVVARFGTYSERLAGFARRAFSAGWVDVPPRKGKRNGAFCSAVHARGESRVMLNFGGTLGDVFTLAHELGHAYHNDCKVRFGRTALQVPTPMTLAETASIFCETVVFDGLVEQGSEAERLAVLEQSLQQSTQLLIDIHSRFQFESAVFARRGERELSDEELSEAMLAAQAATYGDALEEGLRHPLMWAHKPHYYSSDRSFYNFPYTFGWLFALGLYTRYRPEGPSFHERYDELLSSTGIAAASDLARGFGIDIEDPQFWRDSLDVVTQRVDAFEAITAGSAGEA